MKDWLKHDASVWKGVLGALAALLLVVSLGAATETESDADEFIVRSQPLIELTATAAAVSGAGEEDEIVLQIGRRAPVFHATAPDYASVRDAAMIVAPAFAFDARGSPVA